MHDDARYLLDDLLAEWHRWAKGWQDVSAPKTSAMFSAVKISRQWDSEDDVLDGSIHNAQMKAFDFHVNELQPLQRTALQINARNLVTGRSVWTSARLPQDIEARAIILRDARNDLMKRLVCAGIL